MNLNLNNRVRPKVPQADENTDKSVGCCRKVFDVLYKFLYTPVKEMVQTLTKKRANHLKSLLLIQFICYTLYLFSLEFGSLLYLYMLKVGWVLLS
jgi:hypothetical protein